jgi:hypothetical protein
MTALPQQSPEEEQQPPEEEAVTVADNCEIKEASREPVDGESMDITRSWGHISPD